MNPSILVYSKNEKLIENIKNIIGELPYDFRIIESIEAAKKIEHSYKPQIILIDLPKEKSELVKIHGFIYDRFRLARIIALYTQTMPYGPEELGGRRQNLTFLNLTFESDLLISFLFELATVLIPDKKLKPVYMTPISLSDFRTSDKFNFDIYLHMPSNNKFLLYRKKNSSLNIKQITNFQKFKVYDLFVKKSEIALVRQYFSNKLKETFGSKSMPLTEKRLLLQKQVRDIFGSFFDPSLSDYGRNRAILENCKKVAEQFILQISPNPKIYDKILAYTSQNKTNYNQAINVSVFSSLFAIALGYDDIEAASIGGLLHDIGVSALPESITDKSWEQLDDKEKLIYQSHPEKGLKIIENKKIIVSDSIKKIIFQHHERMDGTGYPAKIKKDSIDIYARICGVAIELNDLTSMGPNRKPMNPGQALEHMLANNFKNGGERLDHDILLKLKDVLSTPKVIDIDRVRSSFDKPLSLKNPNASNDDLRRRRRQVTRR